MTGLESFSSTAHLIADPARAIMLTVLLDGRALPAGELAYAAGITPQTASSHLAKLLDGGLLSVETQGRHRYYQLAGSHVAQAIEYLAAIRPETSIRRKALSPKGLALRFCRCCYDHLAGEVGVTICRKLQEQDYIRPVSDKQFVVTEGGHHWFESLGVDVDALKQGRQGIATQCLDWTERVHHLGGPLGTQLYRALATQGWLIRAEASRVIYVTPKGWVELKRQLHLDWNVVSR